MARPLHELIFEQVTVWMRQFKETARTKEEKAYCLDQIRDLLATLERDLN